MKKHFPGYYRPSDKELSKAWKTCIFILDANVLLNLYRYPRNAREDLFRVLRRVSSRLWIPHQAALEYQRNRLGVIAEQVQRFDDVKKLLKKTTSELREGLTQLQLKKRHSAINPDALIDQIEIIVNNFLEDLDTLQREQPDVHREDELRNRIDTLLDGKIGNPFATQKDLDLIYVEGKFRYEHKFPPGYEDLSKSKTDDKEPSAYIAEGLIYKREFGDLILWNQIIQEAKSREWKQVIFITDDDKEDWWWTVDSKGKKTIGPRPELIEEIGLKSGVTIFYAYNSERFLEFAKTFLKADVEQETIDQVREISKLNRNREDNVEMYNPYGIAERAVFDWLKKSYPLDDIVTNSHGFPDFLKINTRENSKIGFEVKYLRNASTIRSGFIFKTRVKDVGYKGFFEISKKELSALKIVIVLDDEDAIKEFEGFVQDPQFEIPPGIQYLIGRLSREDENSTPQFILVSET